MGKSQGIPKAERRLAASTYYGNLILLKIVVWPYSANMNNNTITLSLFAHTDRTHKFAVCDRVRPPSAEPARPDPPPPADNFALCSIIHD
ncbi:hypothetical protein EVAR_17656_1 [Eumeta japonica]|uniref:Uncharacterized protein n=1 Tax=Eumeta variegata TaxID=151549 RepID=A0A4C1USC2_EUMVA|nr:hypothetical protein EVAR_17656_1 [Eumeta japonica]